MSQRVPASMNTRQSLSELIDGRFSTADGRSELVKLATPTTRFRALRFRALRDIRASVGAFF